MKKACNKIAGIKKRTSYCLFSRNPFIYNELYH